MSLRNPFKGINFTFGVPSLKDFRESGIFKVCQKTLSKHLDGSLEMKLSVLVKNINGYWYDMGMSI